MKDISSDFQTAEPLTTIDSIEGEELILNVYFMRNGPSHTNDLQFTIYNSGTAKGMLIIRALCLNARAEKISLHKHERSGQGYIDTSFCSCTLVNSSYSNYIRGCGLSSFSLCLSNTH